MDEKLAKRRLQRLRAFSDKVSELEHATKTYLLQDITISFDADNPQIAPIEGFIDSIVEAGLLALMRQFIDEHENTSFIGICGVLKYYHKDDPEKLNRIGQYKKAWNDKIVGHNSQMGIELEGETLLNMSLVKLLSYTGRLHTDIDQQAYYQVEGLRKSGFTPLLQLQLSGMIEGAFILANSLKVEFINKIANDIHADLHT